MQRTMMTAAPRAANGAWVPVAGVVARAVVITATLAMSALSLGANLDQASADDASGPVRGLEPVAEQLPWFNSSLNYPTWDRDVAAKRGSAVPAVTSVGQPSMDEPVGLLLSRHRYPAEDGYLDAIVRFDVPLTAQPEGRLELRLTNADEEVVSESVIDPIPAAQVYFSYELPPRMHGDTGAFHVRWVQDDAERAEVSEALEVSEPLDPRRSGRINLHVPNETGARVSAAPLTVGVPFPRGVLKSTDNLRLVDEAGEEIPLQAKRTASWSRYGEVKWVLCDFTIDLEGEPRELYLEYGPDITRQSRAAIGIEHRRDTLPHFEAGRLRIDDAGIAFDHTGDGDHRIMLGAEAMAGGFVEHVRGMQARHARVTSGDRFTTPRQPKYTIEEAGPEKVVLRAEGWFEDEASGERFCKFVNRYVLHRDAPIMRVFHTWIFTGDGNSDAIRHMGWRFAIEGMQPLGFLSSFDGDADWLDGNYLLQHDGDAFSVHDVNVDAPHVRVPARFGAEVDQPQRRQHTGERAPGVVAAEGEAGRVYIGVQDFWQNFPSSLRIEDDALTFYQWPRFGRPRENPVQPDDTTDLWRLWFAHEGQTLSFRLPRAVAEGPIFHDEGRGEPHFAFGAPESVNAQGIAKTAEIWLYFTDTEHETAEAVRTLHGLSGETLRAVVDPQWMTDSGAFDAIAAVNREAYPVEADTYDRSVRAPLRQIERMGVYGKWIYGDLLRSPDLDEQTTDYYRTFRKSHWGWPYSWIPFVRSGDVELLRTAQAATRMMSDVAFVHYVSNDIEQHFADLPERRMWDSKQPFRRIGWHNRNLIPWAGYWGPTSRMYVDQADYLWDAWYVSGYHRARDVALAWAEQTRIEEPFTLQVELMGRGPITAAYNRSRWSANLQKQYVEMYQATFDPWFLAAAHAIADMHIWRYRDEGWGGHFWHAGYQAFQRYAQRPDHEEFVLHHADHWADWHHQGWAAVPATLIPSAVFAYLLTSDEYYLRRAAGVADMANWTVYDNEEDAWFYQGWYTRGVREQHMNFTSWYHLWLPKIIGAFEHADGAPEHPLPLAFDQTLGDMRVAVHKRSGEPLTLRPGGGVRVIDAQGETVLDERERDGGGGGWRGAPEDELKLDADLPGGTYIVELDATRVRIPITPPGTPEVLLLPEGETVSWGQHFAQHWFHVPEDVDSFWIEFDNTRFHRQVVRQTVIWDADGNEVWAHRQRDVEYDGEREVIRAEITVEPEQAGRLWRVTLPGGRSMPFRLDPQLPPRLAHDPTRWFEPEPAR